MAVRLGAAEAVLPESAHVPILEQPETTALTLLNMLGAVQKVCP
jgi:hypothetical protein